MYLNRHIDPMFEHDHADCTFLGVLENIEGAPEHRQFADLYYCGGDVTPTVIARYSDEGSDYESGMPDSEPYGSDLEWTSPRHIAASDAFYLGHDTTTFKPKYPRPFTKRRKHFPVRAGATSFYGQFQDSIYTHGSVLWPGKIVKLTLTGREGFAQIVNLQPHPVGKGALVLVRMFVAGTSWGGLERIASQWLRDMTPKETLEWYSLVS